MASTLGMQQPAANTHGGFSMVRVTNSASNPNRMSKPPPKPLVPYMRFSKRIWSKVRAENPDAMIWDIGKLIGKMYRDLPDKEKASLQAEHDLEKVDYDKQMKQLRTTPAYQQNIANKAAGMIRQDPPRTVSDSGVYIQGVDEDDGESQLSMRKVSASRFERNQRLVLDLFSEQCVHDTRTLTTHSRMTMLKRQSTSLAQHQSKLEAELDALDTKFHAKKKLIHDCSHEFNEKLAKVVHDKSHLDDDKYETMVIASVDKLTEAYKTYKTQMDEIERLQKEHKRLLALSPEEREAELTNGKSDDKMEEDQEIAQKTPVESATLNGHSPIPQNEDVTSDEGDNPHNTQ